MPDGKRDSAEILVDAIRETSTSMRETAVELREMSNTVIANTKAMDEMRAEHRRNCDVMGRVEEYLKDLAEAKESRRTSSAAVLQSLQAALKSPAIQFILMAIAFWAAAKMGVLQYFSLTEGANAP